MDLSLLREQRQTRWRLALLSGPNTGPELRAVPDFDQLVDGWAAMLGVRVEQLRSNHEGELLEYVHRSAASTHGYLVNPGGLTEVGESLRHCLKDAGRPLVEVHWRTSELLGRSVFAPTATSICAGLGHLAVLGALVSLVLALDDRDFLHPGGTGETNRSTGVPRSLYQ